MNPRVLVVEDEDSILMSLEFLLGQAGYTVTTAKDGAAGLRAIEQQPHDLILLDVMLPLIDGYELCRLIRENPTRKATRIMLLTARGRESEIARGLALGADAYLTKPFSTRELMDKVRALLPAPGAPEPDIQGST